MRLLIFFGVLALVVISLADKNDKAWEDFKVQNKKSFSVKTQENTRKQIFIANLNDIEKHNARHAKGEESYEKGINQFSDLTYEEFSKKLTGAVRAVNEKKVPNGGQIDLLRGEARQLPGFVDLRNTGFVGRVKNQGNCG
jgi:cathepsin L